LYSQANSGFSAAAAPPPLLLLPPSWLLPLLPRRGPGGGGQGGGGRDSGWHHDASRLPVSLSVQLSPGHFHLQVASDDRLGPLYNNSLSIQDLPPARPRRVGHPQAGRRGHRAPPPPAAA